MTLFEAAGVIGRRAIISAGIESTRQIAKGLLPCHEMDISLVDVLIAGAGSIYGDVSGLSAEGAMGARWAAAFGGGTPESLDKLAPTAD